ncbi:Protein of unknown function DUF504 [Methanothermus fervidus DSM 2088]|uniref:UPF0248 protein Mfer_1226 n=1 Tax=Methanothermus fervidus (strain ATCC 43054 / DSM 2088 / JCM 10308 / V24 S) TaxID=523846 RepID=E3GWU3_METFV|nr:DUF504 domain-containing protein [Methanothermus fervidus]ADP78012.1 Protein of unknown function DUF504 [Methanothermus fervidus DSM 2088]
MAQNIINMLKWHPKYDLSNCKITYIHRGSPGNLKTIKGSEIKNIDRGFIILKNDVAIPYHRIVKVQCKNFVWERK